jgi:hypothetical protein
VQQLTAGFEQFLIGVRDETRALAPHLRVLDEVSARRAFRPCLGSYHAMRVLRAEVESATRAGHAGTLTDAAVIDLAVRLVCGGRLYLLGPLPALGSKLMPLSTAVAASAPPPPPPRAASSSSSSSKRAPVEASESPFRADLDASALAASLRGAAQDGTPFCEECARAARAA